MTMHLSAIALAAAWGLVCGLFERFLMAPRRHLSSVGPAYFPAMLLAFLACMFYLTDKNGVRFPFALLMGVAYFVMGAAPALATFHLSRLILRTRSSDQTKP